MIYDLLMPENYIMSKIIFKKNFDLNLIKTSRK